jgi:hypothetical protein
VRKRHTNDSLLSVLLEFLIVSRDLSESRQANAKEERPRERFLCWFLGILTTCLTSRIVSFVLQYAVHTHFRYAGMLSQALDETDGVEDGISASIGVHTVSSS